VANQTKEAQCLKNQLSLSAAARMIYAQNILNGTSEYPAQINDLASHISKGFTTTCSDGITPLVYNNTTGAVTCPNHPR